MADALKIKLSIADRVYRLTIQSHQEEGLRKAAKKIEAMTKQFEQSYAVRDKHTVLAMCALQCAAQTEKKSRNNNSDVELAEEKLRSLNDLLQQHLAT